MRQITLYEKKSFCDLFVDELNCAGLFHTVAGGTPPKYLWSYISDIFGVYLKDIFISTRFVRITSDVLHQNFTPLPSAAQYPPPLSCFFSSLALIQVSMALPLQNVCSSLVNLSLTVYVCVCVWTVCVRARPKEPSSPL